MYGGLRSIYGGRSVYGGRTTRLITASGRRRVHRRRGRGFGDVFRKIIRGVADVGSHLPGPFGLPFTAIKHIGNAAGLGRRRRRRVHRRGRGPTHGSYIVPRGRPYGAGRRRRRVYRRRRIVRRRRGRGWDIKGALHNVFKQFRSH